METVCSTIKGAPGGPSATILLKVLRETLAKRRWRGVADDGKEFGFDLEEPMEDGAVFCIRNGKEYRVAQQAEPVLELQIVGAKRMEEAARAGWLLGNLHFPVEIAEGVIRVGDDPATRRALEQADLPFEKVERVFHPGKSQAHGHAH